MTNNKVTYACGACKAVFDSNALYIAHKCSVTGFTPADIEHQDKMTHGQASIVSKAALERGANKIPDNKE